MSSLIYFNIVSLDKGEWMIKSGYIWIRPTIVIKFRKGQSDTYDIIGILVTCDKQFIEIDCNYRGTLLPDFSSVLQFQIFWPLVRKMWIDFWLGKYGQRMQCVFLLPCRKHSNCVWGEREGRGWCRGTGQSLWICNPEGTSFWTFQLP